MYVCMYVCVVVVVVVVWCGMMWCGGVLNVSKSPSFLCMLQRRMRLVRLKIWFGAWIGRIAEHRQRQRVLQLRERLSYSVHVPTALEECPMLKKVCVCVCVCVCVPSVRTTLTLLRVFACHRPCTFPHTHTHTHTSQFIHPRI